MRILIGLYGFSFFLQYTAAHRLGIVTMALDSIFMRVYVNGNLFENYYVCTKLTSASLHSFGSNDKRIEDILLITAWYK